jgi:hypothetical protein
MMKLRLGMAIVALLLSFPGVLLVLRAQEELPEGEGKKVVERVCTDCHGTDEITSIKRTPDQWRRIVKDMLDRRDTKTSDEEAKQIIEYLIAHFSRQADVQARDDLSVRIIHKDGGRGGAFAPKSPPQAGKTLLRLIVTERGVGTPAPRPVAGLRSVFRAIGTACSEGFSARARLPRSMVVNNPN